MRKKPPLFVGRAAVRSQEYLLMSVGAGRRAFPLRQIVGNNPARFHRGLTELRVSGKLTLNALTFIVHQVAKAFEFADQILDFVE